MLLKCVVVVEVGGGSGCCCYKCELVILGIVDNL